MSPFRKITQQLGDLDLKSPDLEDFATPMGPAPDLWPQVKSNRNSNSHYDFQSSGSFKPTKSPSSMDISTISNIQNTVKSFNQQMTRSLQASNDQLSCSLPVDLELNTSDTEAGLRFSETHFEVSGEVLSVDSNEAVSTQSTPLRKQSTSLHSKMTQSMTETSSVSAESSYMHQLAESKDEIMREFDSNGFVVQNCSIMLGHNGAFLDTKMMSASPSANYYRPTEEPEPLDLTQLNIEASVMCLVSKVKFLCGRCGSPAVRLRQPKPSMKRGFSNLQPVS